MDNDTQSLTPDEVAKIYKVSKRTVYRLAGKGELGATRIGGQWRFFVPQPATPTPPEPA